MSLNLLSIPFVIMVVLGLVVFVVKRRNHFFYVAITALVLYAVAFVGVYPYGGVRHSFTIAPFIYVLLGYGVFVLHKRPAIQRVLSGGLVILAIGLWAVWGRQLYPARDMTLDVVELQAMAQTYDVAHIVAHYDTYDVLRVLDSTNGHMLAQSGIEIRGMWRLDEIDDLNLENPFLLVSYSKAINPSWQNPIGTFSAEILYTPGRYSVTPVIEHMGPLPPQTQPQSIYDPLNGLFVYHVVPVDGNEQ